MPLRKMGLIALFAFACCTGFPSYSFADTFQAFGSNEIIETGTDGQDAISPQTSVDQSWSFVLYGGGKNSTSWRQKDNATSMYVYCRSITNGVMHLGNWGAWNASGSGAKNCTQGNPVLRKEGEYEVWNTVYESGMRWSQMIGSSNQTHCKANGKWSPDTVGHFTVLS